eukprot:SAG11_NODE_2455_length_3343_cov_2.469482_3_plen_67_part_00
MKQPAAAKAAFARFPARDGCSPGLASSMTFKSWRPKTFKVSGCNEARFAVQTVDAFAAVSGDESVP